MRALTRAGHLAAHHQPGKPTVYCHRAQLVTWLDQEVPAYPQDMKDVTQQMLAQWPCTTKQLAFAFALAVNTQSYPWWLAFSAAASEALLLKWHGYLYERAGYKGAYIERLNRFGWSLFIDALLKRDEGDRADLHTNYNATLSLLANAPLTRRPRLTLIQGGLAEEGKTPTSPYSSIEATSIAGKGENTLSRLRDGYASYGCSWRSPAVAWLKSESS